jgi:hypothetical protein
MLWYPSGRFFTMFKPMFILALGKNIILLLPHFLLNRMGKDTKKITTTNQKHFFSLLLLNLHLLLTPLNPTLISPNATLTFPNAVSFPPNAT